MAKKQTTARNKPFFLTKEEAVRNDVDNYTLYKMVEDEDLPRPTSFENINYQNFSKVDLMNAYITLYNRLQTMEQSYSELMVKNSILQDRLVINELPVTMDLDEIKNYRVTLELALQNTLGNLKQKLPTDIQLLVETKVIEEVRKTQIEQGMMLEFQVFEISRLLKLNTEAQLNVMSSYDEASKKATAIKNLQSAYSKLIDVLSDLKQNGKGIDEMYANGGSEGGSEGNAEDRKFDIDDEDDEDDLSDFID